MPSVSDYYVKVLDVLELLLPALIKVSNFKCCLPVCTLKVFSLLLYDHLFSTWILGRTFREAIYITALPEADDDFGSPGNGAVCRLQGEAWHTISHNFLEHL